jgi:hypothetical protein
MGPDTRRSLATALVVLTAVLLTGATLAGYARRAFFDSNQFADRAASTLADPSVRTLVGDRVTDDVILRHQADLLPVRPAIASAVEGIVGGGAFRSLLRRAALDAHRAVFEHDQNTVVLTLADVGTVVAAAVHVLRPDLARQVEDSGHVAVVHRDLGSAGADAARIASDVGLLAIVLAVLTIAAAVGALAITPDRRHTASRLGVAVAIVGVLVVVTYAIARAVVLGRFHDPDERAAAAAVWSAFLGDLRTWGWLLAGSGAAVTAAASSLVRPVAVEGMVVRAWRAATTEPESTRLRVGRAIALIVVGVFVIAQPLTAVQVAAILVGVYVAYKGLEAILRLVYQPPEPGAAHQPARERRARRAGRARRIAVPALTALLVAGIVAAVLGSGGASAPAASTASCEGHAQLCDRPLDEVVLPATHNSMSAPLPGWFAAEQDRSIGGQLEDGIRGLLFDTHYADRLDNGRVRTFFQSREDLGLINDQDGVSDEDFAAALRIRERLGFRGEGARGMYLCHTLCELGATPLASGLDDIHDFLVTHASEVVVVVNQDYVTPADFVKAVGDAGLARYAFTPPADGDWPTLREMIEADQRLVLLAENHAGAAPWYQLAYKRLTEETPYTFPRPSLLTTKADLPASCEPNRGPKDAPLFLINHWVSTDPTPRPSDADKVNAYKPLLARARECERIRDHLPNLLAVNFYKRGDVFRVTDTLNGI